MRDIFSGVAPLMLVIAGYMTSGQPEQKPKAPQADIEAITQVAAEHLLTQLAQVDLQPEPMAEPDGQPEPKAEPIEVTEVALPGEDCVPCQQQAQLLAQANVQMPATGVQASPGAILSQVTEQVPVDRIRTVWEAQERERTITEYVPQQRTEKFTVQVPKQVTERTYEPRTTTYSMPQPVQQVVQHVVQQPTTTCSTCCCCNCCCQTTTTNNGCYTWPVSYPSGCTYPSYPSGGQMCLPLGNGNVCFPFGSSSSCGSSYGMPVTMPSSGCGSSGYGGGYGYASNGYTPNVTIPFGPNGASTLNLPIEPGQPSPSRPWEDCRGLRHKLWKGLGAFSLWRASRTCITPQELPTF